MSAARPNTGERQVISSLGGQVPGERSSNPWSMHLRRPSRSTALRLLAAAAMLSAGLFAVPSQASPAAATAGFVNEHAYVPTPYGEIYVQYWRPASGRVPVILSMSPYRYVYGRANPGDVITDAYSDRYLRRGYGRAYADLLGTGLSGGCWNYGGHAEAAAGAAVVEWLAAQPWSTGKIGMIGTSYDGAIQLEIATLAPKHLAAIVPQEPVASWYHYNYDHGVLYNSSDEESKNVDQTGYLVGTPDLFDVGLSRTPNTDPDRTPQQRAHNLSDRTAECELVEHEYRGHLVDPSYGAFWRERDWALRAGNVRAAVLFQHGWDDNNTKTQHFARFWAGLTHSVERRALLGQWVHTDVFDGGASDVKFPIDRKAYLDAFFARWLMGGSARALAAFPRVLSQAQDGSWRASFPYTVRPTVVSWTEAGSFRNTGTESSASYVRVHPAATPNYAELSQAPVRMATRLAGTGAVTVSATSSSVRGQLDVTLYDQAPDGSRQVIALGMLDLRYRADPDAPSSLVPDEPFSATVELRPQDWVLPVGHRLALILAGSETVWGVPDPAVGQQVTLRAVRLSLPLSRG